MDAPFYLLVAIGLISGVLSGIFGIGGGVVMVPALIYLAGFRQHVATGTSLAVLLPPVGVGAVIEYYRHGNVDIRAAMVLAIALLSAATLALSLRIDCPVRTCAWHLARSCSCWGAI
jgi:uncharacterized membrane protein YfcA